jgi:hypothetical protein
MDDLSRYPTYDMNVSPATAVKTRTKAKRASSSDDTPCVAPKRKYTRKKGTVEAKFGVQAGGSELTGCLMHFPATKVEAETQPPPPRTPLFGFHSPHESWLEATGTPSPTNSVQYHRNSANFYSSFEPSFPSIPFGVLNKPRGRKIDLGPCHVSPVRGRYAPGGLMKSADPFRPVQQYTFATSPTTYKAASYAMDAHTNSSASEAMNSGAFDEIYSTGNPNVHSLSHCQVNEEVQVNVLPSGPSNTGSSAARIYKHPHPFSLSTENLTPVRNRSTENLDATFEGLEAACITEWQPAGLLSMDSQSPESQYALLVLNQPIQNLNMLRLIWKKGMSFRAIQFSPEFIPITAHKSSAFFRIAADGGANRLSDAFKDPCLNEDYKKIVRTKEQILSFTIGGLSITDLLRVWRLFAVILIRCPIELEKMQNDEAPRLLKILTNTQRISQSALCTCGKRSSMGANQHRIFCV